MGGGGTQDAPRRRHQPRGRLSKGREAGGRGTRRRRFRGNSHASRRDVPAAAAAIATQETRARACSRDTYYYRVIYGVRCVVRGIYA